MPLMQSKSKKAFGKNVSAEMHAGKPQKQSLAIAYSVQAHAKKKKQSNPKLEQSKMAYGGRAEDDNEPSVPMRKSDDKRLPDLETMSDQWSKGSPPARKPDDQRRPKEAYIDTNDWSDGEEPSRKPFADGGKVLTSKPNSPRPSQSSTESEDLNARAARQAQSPAQMAEYHEQEAARYRMMADGGMIGEVDDMAQETQAPMTPGRKADDQRRPQSAYMNTDQWSDGEMPSRKPFAKGGIAEAIMSKRKRMADGGEVDIEENGEEEGSSPYDDMNSDAVMKELYDDSQLDDQPEDSNEKADSEEEDSENKNDMISAIRKKMKAKKAS